MFICVSLSRVKIKIYKHIAYISFLLLKFGLDGLCEVKFRSSYLKFSFSKFNSVPNATIRPIVDKLQNLLSCLTLSPQRRHAILLIILIEVLL